MNTNTTFTKTLNLGKVDYNNHGRKDCLVDVEIKLTETEDGKQRLSICGNVWNSRKTDLHAGGQCYETIRELFPNNDKVKRIVEIWERWHLNDMNAGCEHQRALGWGKDTVVLKDGSTKGTGWLNESEHPQGVLCKPCPECGYKYGTKWMYEAIPQEIIDELISLTSE